MGEVIKAHRRHPTVPVVRVTGLSDAAFVQKAIEGVRMKRATRFVRETYGSDFLVEGGSRPGAWGHGKWGSYVLIDGMDTVQVMSPEEFEQFYEVVPE